MGFRVVFDLILLLGWVLGTIGFFSAGKARAEIRALRLSLLAARPPETGPAVIAAGGASVPESRPVTAPPQTAMPPPPLIAPQKPPPAAPARDLETLLTTRWGVWLGAAALAFAGIFLVRYAVDHAVLRPAARCCLGVALGCALIGAAEWLVRTAKPGLDARFSRDQAPGALAAGGAAILFGAAYAAGPFFGLLPPFLAFAFMAAAGLVGLGAALRYGQLAAAVGIAATFATPALVASTAPSMVGLFAYLFVVSAAALYVLRRTAWTWLGWATLTADAIWVCMAAASGAPDAWVAALFVPAAAWLNMAALPDAALDHRIGRILSWVPVAVLGAAGLVLEAALPGLAPKIGLFALAPLAVWKGMATPRLDRLPWLTAAIGLLTLLFWALPDWHPSPEFIGVEGLIEALLPGTWAPNVIRPLLLAAILFALFHASAGAVLERRARHPLHWAALTAAVPVLTLAVAYAQIERFQADGLWASAAMALAAALTANAAAAGSVKQRAGIHAAGAVAALALGCAMLLHDQFLTLAIALFLPALAWIEAQADLPALRQVALAVAGLVLVRLVLNGDIFSYAYGALPLANGLVAAYAAPSAAFAVAAVLFRRRGDDLVVASLEAGAIALAACFVALELRHGFGRGALTGPILFGEAATQVAMLAVQAFALLVAARRTGRFVFDIAWRVLGGFALAGAGVLLLANPAVTGAQASLVSLLAAYLVPGGLAVLARRRVADPDIGRALAIYAVLAGFVWITVQIRLAFHPGHMASAGVEDAELWAWSGGWLCYGLALMVLGIRHGERMLRLIALGIIALVSAKVFLVDMAGLTGLWRVLSFLGLGLTLIGLGTVHRRFVLPAHAA
jgi:uncharacterized membrane protein